MKEEVKVNELNWAGSAFKGRRSSFLSTRRTLWEKTISAYFVERFAAVWGLHSQPHRLMGRSSFFDHFDASSIGLIGKKWTTEFGAPSFLGRTQLPAWDRLRFLSLRL